MIQKLKVQIQKTVILGSGTGITYCSAVERREDTIGTADSVDSEK